AEIDDLLARPDAEWPLAAPARALPPGLSDADRTRLADAILAAISERIRPAFARDRAFLRDEPAPVPRRDDRPGLAAIPGGPEAYARLIRSHTTLDLGPEEIHRIGLDEVTRIDDEFGSLGARVLGTGDRHEVIARLRNDPALHFATSREVFDVAEASLARANAAIGDWFGRLPRAECIV